MYNDDLPLPDLRVLEATTIALMSAWASNPMNCKISQAQANLIAKKIVSNLFFMVAHPEAGALTGTFHNALHCWTEIAAGNQQSDDCALGLADQQGVLQPKRFH